MGSSSFFGRLGARALRIVPAFALLVGLAGCLASTLDDTTLCLEQHPGRIGCCPPDTHVDHGTCCPSGSHELSDVEHVDWRICVWDEVPCADAGACRDAGGDAAADAGIDAS